MDQHNGFAELPTSLPPFGKGGATASKEKGCPPCTQKVRGELMQTHYGKRETTGQEDAVMAGVTLGSEWKMINTIQQ